MAAGSLLLANTSSLYAALSRSRLLSLSPYKLGICDWDVRETGKPTSFAIAKELGFEGVQVTYQPTGAESLSIKANRVKFVDAAKAANVSIASLCMGILNNSPFATTVEAESWALACIDTMVDMQVDQVLLAFFSKGDMNEIKTQQPLAIEKLKRIAPMAEKKNKILAIESYLSAEDHLKFLDAIGSDAVKVYYDVRNSFNKGYDIFREMELLGKKKLISQIHLKEDHDLLGKGDINFTKVFEMLEKIDYNGWLIVEGSSKGDWKESHKANVRFIKQMINK